MPFNTVLKCVDSYIAFDTETTGVKYKRDRITQIGAVKVIGREVVGRFEMLLNPGMPIPPEVIKLTKITNEMVADAPSSEEGVGEFLEFAGGLPLVGQNVTFDARMLNVPYLANELIDTLRIGRRVCPGLPNHKLGTLYDYCLSQGLCAEIVGSAHRADFDAEMTRVVYESLRPELVDYLANEGPESRSAYHDPRVRLSDRTKQKAEILARIRVLATEGISDFGSIEWLCDDIASYDDLENDSVLMNLLELMSQAIADSVITPAEQNEILAECRKLADPVIRLKHFPVEFKNRRFVLTGSFEHGDDAMVVEAISNAGGVGHKKAPCAKDDYVVVGNNGSSRWAYGNYGTKVDTAIALQEKGKPISIISEDVLFASLEDAVAERRSSHAVITDDEKEIREKFGFRKNIEKYPLVYKRRLSDGGIGVTPIKKVELIQLDSNGEIGSLLIYLPDDEVVRITSAYLVEMQLDRFSFDYKGEQQMEQ